DHVGSLDPVADRSGASLAAEVAPTSSIVGFTASAAALPPSPPATAPTAAPTTAPIGPPTTAPSAAPAAPALAAPAPTPTGCAPGACVIGSRCSGSACAPLFRLAMDASSSRLGWAADALFGSARRPGGHPTRRQVAGRSADANHGKHAVFS